MKKRSKVISWNICDACNYDCSYCVQGKHHNGFPSEHEMMGIASFIAGLGVEWEVKISGGEPFFCPEFLNAVRILVKGGVKVSVVTNFSFTRRLYADFIESTGKNLCSFSVSLHREKADVIHFLKKCLWARRKLNRLEHASFVVNSVVIPGSIDELLQIKRKLSSHGIRFYPQLKRERGKAVEYTEGEKKQIRELAGGSKDPFHINMGYSFKGTTCYAGMDYFIITMHGECYTCYPGKRSGKGFLGNIVEGSMKLMRHPITCPYDACPCTVPINRGIVGTTGT